MSRLSQILSVVSSTLGAGFLTYGAYLIAGFAAAALCLAAIFFFIGWIFAHISVGTRDGG